jgi:hypothetical protein
MMFRINASSMAALHVDAMARAVVIHAKRWWPEDDTFEPSARVIDSGGDVAIEITVYRDGGVRVYERNES